MVYIRTSKTFENILSMICRDKYKQNSLGWLYPVDTSDKLDCSPNPNTGWKENGLRAALGEKIWGCWWMKRDLYNLINHIIYNNHIDII